MRDRFSYDIIGFGDEIPGILALVSASREHRRRTGRFARILLMCRCGTREGIGGHLVRGGLAYLDRSQIHNDLRRQWGLDLFGAPVPIYREFLQRAEVRCVALDPQKADTVLRQLLWESDIDLLSHTEVTSVVKQGEAIAGITLAQGKTYWGKQFIDSTVNAHLAQLAGVKKLKGFETFGLPESELPVSLVFETRGITPNQLRQLELDYLRRFTNLNDAEAQKFLLHAADMDPVLARKLREDMLDPQGNLKSFWTGVDYIDVRSPALSVAYHSYRGKRLSLYDTGVVLDKGNIAILGSDRLSWNALLLAVTGSEAEQIARNNAKPTPRMVEEMNFLRRWFGSLGATAVTPASELYIRHAGNILGAVQPLTGAAMLAGGVPSEEAIATFAYHFDVRGGIHGIGEKAYPRGFASTQFDMPVFNVGIRHAQVRQVPNLAVVSPGSGFEGMASSAGRIVEFNVAVGQGIGVAAVLALLQGRNLAEVSNLEVRRSLYEAGQLPTIFGVPNPPAAARLKDFETAMTGASEGIA